LGTSEAIACGWIADLFLYPCGFKNGKDSAAVASASWLAGVRYLFHFSN